MSLSINDQKRELLSFVKEQCPGAVLEGITLHYTKEEIHVNVDFGAVSEQAPFSAQLIWIIQHRWFDEELVQPFASTGDSLEEAMKNSASEFCELVLKPVLATFSSEGTEVLTADIMGETHRFRVPSGFGAIHQGSQKKPDLWNAVKDVIPSYLGKKRAYWVNLFSMDMGQKQACEARINGTVYPDLTDSLYEELYARKEKAFSVDKAFILLLQEEETFKPCPFTKQQAGELTFQALERLSEITDETSKQKKFLEIHKLSPDKSIATELIAFLPEIVAQRVAQFRDNDTIIPVKDYGKPEFYLKKSQVRSYGYMEDAVDQYFRKLHPEKEEIRNILRISGKMEAISRAMQDNEIRVQDFRMSQLVYFIDKDYYIW